LLEHILKRAAEDPRVAEVYLHVQITNEEARSFYKSNGFVEGEMIRDYYKRIDPPHCFIFRRSVMHPGLN
jgi:ribosomal protein S18 acetylase RimI-like enzyme